MKYFSHSQNRRIIKELNKVSQEIAKNKLSVKLNGISIRGRNEMCLNDTLLELKLNPKESHDIQIQIGQVTSNSNINEIREIIQTILSLGANVIIIKGTSIKSLVSFNDSIFSPG